MTLLLLVTLLATAGLPPASPDARQAAPLAAPDSLGAFGALGPLTSPGTSGKDPFAGFS